jgi:probable rRNA maturation factor
LTFAPAEASVMLTTDDVVRGLNRQWRGKNQPTNVLSFPAPARQPGAPLRYLGDVVLAADTVHREAEEMQIDPAHHITHLVVHGLLHLLGYDHETDAEAETMERLETIILARLGIADPHAGPLLSAAHS